MQRLKMFLSVRANGMSGFVNIMCSLMITANEGLEALTRLTISWMLSRGAC